MKNFFNIKKLGLSALVLSSLGLWGCVTPSNSPNVYGNGQGAVMGESQLMTATIQNIRSVIIQNPNTNIGGLAGSALGAIGASGIGQGRGAAVMGIVGGVLGSVAGQHIENSINKQTGMEITVLYPDGRQSVIVQAAVAGLAVGQKVNIVKGPDGNARVIPLS